MKLIPLTQGYFAQVDDEDFDRVNQFEWYAHRAGKIFYATRNVPLGGGRRRTQKMHAFLMDPPPGTEIHHIDGDGLNNQRSKNLRIVTPEEHSQIEYRRRISNSSGFRGVYFHRHNGRWCAGIQNSYIGSYATAAGAAHARDARARALGWPEASMNFPL